MPKPEQSLPLFETDPAEIEALLEHLRQAFETYVNAHGIKYPNAFMAVHNFHKLVVSDLIEHRGQPPEIAYIAVYTFAQAMQRAHPEGWSIDGLPMEVKSYPKKGGPSEEE